MIGIAGDFATKKGSRLEAERGQGSKPVYTSTRPYLGLGRRGTLAENSPQQRWYRSPALNPQHPGLRPRLAEESTVGGFPPPQPLLPNTDTDREPPTPRGRRFCFLRRDRPWRRFRQSARSRSPSPPDARQRAR